MDNKVQQLKDEITLAQSRISILMISTLAQMEADTKAREAMYTETLEDSKATISELHSQFSAVKEELDEQRKENKELKEKEQSFIDELSAQQKQITDMIPAIQLLDNMQSHSTMQSAYQTQIDGVIYKLEDVRLYEHIQQNLIPRFLADAPSLYSVLEVWRTASAFDFLSIGAETIRTILIQANSTSWDLFNALANCFYGEYPEMIDELRDVYGALVYETNEFNSHVLINGIRNMYNYETIGENEEHRNEEELEGLTKVAENVPSTLDVEELVEKVETVAKTPASKRPRPKKQPINSSKP